MRAVLAVELSKLLRQRKTWLSLLFMNVIGFTCLCLLYLPPVTDAIRNEAGTLVAIDATLRGVPQRFLAALVAARRGHPEEARAGIAQARRISQELGLRRDAADALLDLAEVELLERRNQEAKEALQQAAAEVNLEQFTDLFVRSTSLRARVDISRHSF